MKHILALIAICSLASIASAASKPLKIFILAGQSNMDGRGKKSELTGDLAKWADRFFFANGVEYLNLPKFIQRHEQYNPGFLSASAKSELLVK